MVELACHSVLGGGSLAAQGPPQLEVGQSPHRRDGYVGGAGPGTSTPTLLALDLEALDLDPAAVADHDRLGDAQPQADAPDRPLSGMPGAEEPAEVKVAVAHADADAGVEDDQRPSVVGDREVDLAPAAVRRVLDGVREHGCPSDRVQATQ